METKQWYAVYTRPRWEKKVSELLTRKGVQNYCPLNRVIHHWSDRKKMIYEPLFTSYVFVHTSEKEHIILKQTPGIINLVYWLKKPAVIRDVEIEMIQRFLTEHKNVQLKKTSVSVNDIVRVLTGPFVSQEGHVVEVKNKSVKLILPSLGYMMYAEIEASNLEVIQPQAKYSRIEDQKIAG